MGTISLVRTGRRFGRTRQKNCIWNMPNEDFRLDVLYLKEIYMQRFYFSSE